MKSTNSFHLTLFLVSFPLVTHSVPDPICDDYFDDDDCGKPPVTMFYYYKSGSRCEMRIWRGCPTLNKFPDQFSCVHFCVGRIWGVADEIPSMSIGSSLKEDLMEEYETEEYEMEEDEMEEHLLPKEMEKEKAAKIAEIVEDQNKWKEEIKALDVEEIKKIDEILDNVVDVVDYHVKDHAKEKLKQKNKGKKDEKPKSDEKPSAEESTTPVNLDALFQPWSSSEMLAHIQGMSEEEVIVAQG